MFPRRKLLLKWEGFRKQKLKTSIRAVFLPFFLFPCSIFFMSIVNYWTLIVMSWYLTVIIAYYELYVYLDKSLSVRLHFVFDLNLVLMSHSMYSTQYSPLVPPLSWQYQWRRSGNTPGTLRATQQRARTLLLSDCMGSAHNTPCRRQPHQSL